MFKSTPKDEGSKLNKNQIKIKTLSLYIARGANRKNSQRNRPVVPSTWKTCN